MKGESEFFKMPVPPCPETDIRPSINGKEQFIYTAERLNDVLVLTVYVPGGGMEFRTFQSKIDLCSVRPGFSKPGHATIFSLEEWNGHYIPSGEADDVIQKWFADIGYHKNTGQRPFDRLEKYQQGLREYNLQEQYRKIKELDDFEMQEIRPLPKEVIDWVDRILMKSSRYIFYRYSKNKSTTGYCTHCKSMVTVSGAKNKGKGRCASCHSAVTYLADGQFCRTNGFKDKEEFAYFQTAKSGFFIRTFSVERRYNYNTYTAPSDIETIQESQRIRYDHEYEKQCTWNYADFRQTGEYRFCRESNYNLNYFMIYPGNLNQIIKGNKQLQYSKIQDIARYGGKIKPDELMIEPRRKKWIEYLPKLGLYKLAAEIINSAHYANYNGINLTGNNLQEILGIDRQDAAILKSINANLKQLRLYQAMKARWGKADTSVLRWAKQSVDSEELFSAIIKKVRPEKAVKYIDEQLKTQKTPNIPRSSYESANFQRDWRDYLEECELLGYEMTDSVTMPRDLHTAHTATSMLIKTMKNKAFDEAISRINKNMSPIYGFKNDKFLIRLPKSSQELVDEGKKLKHCVGGYIERHAKQSTMILFIRDLKKPGTPFFTLEYNNNQIQQCRGKINCSPPPEVSDFMKQWEKEIKKRILQSTAKEHTKLQAQQALQAAV